MLNGDKIRVGDKIVEFGQVYRVFEIKKKPQRVIFYRPFYKSVENHTIVYSIPSKNISKTRIRRPVSKIRLKKLFKRLSKKAKNGIIIDADEAKEILNLNNPCKTIKVLKSYWIDKKNEDTNFTTLKKAILELAEERFVEEVALVAKLSIKDAHEKIFKALQKALI